MKKNLSEKQKKLIAKRYLNGESITNLTRGQCVIFWTAPQKVDTWET